MLRQLLQTAKLVSGRGVHNSAIRTAGIPLVIDNDGRGERVYDIYSRLLKDRIVCVMAPVSFVEHNIVI